MIVLLICFGVVLCALCVIALFVRRAMLLEIAVLDQQLTDGDDLFEPIERVTAVTGKESE